MSWVTSHKIYVKPHTVIDSVIGIQSVLGRMSQSYWKYAIGTTRNYLFRVHNVLGKTTQSYQECPRYDHRKWVSEWVSYGVN